MLRQAQHDMSASCLRWLLSYTHKLRQAQHDVVVSRQAEPVVAWFLEIN